MQTYLVRVWLPDRPGALGLVASRIGSVNGDVVGIDILETGEGQAVDELVVELPDPSLVELLVHEVTQVDGVKIEDVRPLDGVHDPRLEALETAAILVGAATRSELLDAICHHAGRSLTADWVAVAHLRSAVVERATAGAPSGEWLAAFLEGSRTAASLAGIDAGSDDVAWAPMTTAGLAVIVGRDHTAYRSRERRQLAALARIVDIRHGELSGRAPSSPRPAPIP